MEKNPKQARSHSRTLQKTSPHARPHLDTLAHVSTRSPGAKPGPGGSSLPPAEVAHPPRRNGSPRRGRERPRRPPGGDSRWRGVEAVAVYSNPAWTIL